MESKVPHSNKCPVPGPNSCDDEHPEPSVKHGKALPDTWPAPRDNSEKPRQGAQLARTTFQTGLKASIQAQCEKLERGSGERSAFGFSAGSQAEKKRKGKAENTVKTSRNKLEALALAKAEYEEIWERFKRRSAKKEKDGVKKTAKEDAQHNFESLPLGHIQNEPGNTESGDSKANPIIILDPGTKGLEEGDAEVAKGVNVTEKADVVDAPLSLTAEQELERLVNQVDAKLIYSRFKDLEGDGDSDVHMQVILLWRGRQKIVGHAWEISEEAAGRVAAKKLLSDQCFFQELARMRLVMIKRVQADGKAPMAKHSAAYFKQQYLPLVPSPLQVDKKVLGVTDPAAYLMKGGTSSNMEDIVIETEILNHEDPLFKSARTPVVVKSHTLAIIPKS